MIAESTLTSLSKPIKMMMSKKRFLTYIQITWVQVPIASFKFQYVEAVITSLIEDMPVCSFSSWSLFSLFCSCFATASKLNQIFPRQFLLVSLCNFLYIFFFEGLSGAMASISVRSGAPGSPTHVSGSSSGGGGSSGSTPVCRSRRNGLQDVDLNTFISEEMALHLDSTGSASAGGGGARKRNSTQCSDVITDSPTHKRNRMIWSTARPCMGRALQG